MYYQSLFHHSRRLHHSTFFTTADTLFAALTFLSKSHKTLERAGESTFVLHQLEWKACPDRASSRAPRKECYQLVSPNRSDRSCSRVLKREDIREIAFIRLHTNGISRKRKLAVESLQQAAGRVGFCMGEKAGKAVSRQVPGGHPGGANRGSHRP